MSKKLFVIPPNMALFAIKDLGEFDNSHEWWDKWNDIIRMESRGWDTFRKMSNNAIVITPSQIKITPLRDANSVPYVFIKLNHPDWIGYIIRETDLLQIEVPSEIIEGHYE